MSKLSFSEYCKSKEYLRLAAESIPQLVEVYELTKYCKFPIITEEDDKQYVAFKPKDRIEVLWEYLDEKAPVARKVTVITDDEEESRVHPSWGNIKLASWLAKNTNKTN
jgi:hypothetical protein